MRGFLTEGNRHKVDRCKLSQDVERDSNIEMDADITCHQNDGSAMMESNVRR